MGWRCNARSCLQEIGVGTCQQPTLARPPPTNYCNAYLPQLIHSKAAVAVGHHCVGHRGVQQASVTSRLANELRGRHYCRRTGGVAACQPLQRQQTVGHRRRLDVAQHVHSMAWHGMMQPSTAWHGMAPHGMAQHDAPQHSMPLAPSGSLPARAQTAAPGPAVEPCLHTSRAGGMEGSGENCRQWCQAAAAGWHHQQWHARSSCCDH